METAKIEGLEEKLAKVPMGNGKSESRNAKYSLCGAIRNIEKVYLNKSKD